MGPPSCSPSPSPEGALWAWHLWCCLCRAAVEGADAVASGTVAFVTWQPVCSLISFRDLTPSGVLSDCLQAVIYPSLSEPALCSSSVWAELCLKANSLGPRWCSCRSRRCFQQEPPNLRLTVQTRAVQANICVVIFVCLFAFCFQRPLDPLDPLRRPKSRSSRSPEEIPASLLLLSVGVCPSAHAGGSWRFVSTASRLRKGCASC